jgi:hypothetical protein
VVGAVGERRDLIVVAQSLGGVTAALVCDRLPVRLLVLVAGMTLLPGETGGDWLRTRGTPRAAQAAGTDFADDMATVYTTSPATSPRRHPAVRATRPGRPGCDPWPPRAASME